MTSKKLVLSLLILVFTPAGRAEPASFAALSPTVRDNVERNTVVIRKTAEGAIYRLLNPVLWSNMQSSGFVVRGQRSRYVISAAHGFQHFRNGNAGAYIYRPIYAGVPVTSYFEDERSAYEFASRKGFDFALIDFRKIETSVFTDVSESPGLTIRDLIAFPLSNGEPIFFAGRRQGIFATFSCSYIGIDKGSLRRRSFSFLAHCNNPNLSLEGNSGGAFFDQNGLVVGVFTGFIPRRNLIIGTPVYRTSGRMEYSPIPLGTIRSSVFSTECFDQAGVKSEKPCVIEQQGNGTLRFTDDAEKAWF